MSLRRRIVSLMSWSKFDVGCGKRYLEVGREGVKDGVCLLWENG